MVWMARKCNETGVASTDKHSLSGLNFANLAGAQERAQVKQQTSVLSDATYLRKLSLHLRGLNPSRDDYKALSQISNEQGKTDFFGRKIEEYLHSPEAADRMVSRLSERFGVKTPIVDWTSYSRMKSDQRGRSNGPTQNSLAALLRS